MLASLLYILATTASITSATPLLSTRHSSGIPFSKRSIPFNGKVARSPSHPLERRWEGNDVVLTGPLGGLVYTMPITIGSQNFTVRLDTGSADLWVPASNCTCTTTNATATTAAEAAIPVPAKCQFASPGYDPSKSDTFKQLPLIYNQSFSGGAVTGGVGADDVTFGGITVHEQEFAYADHSGVIWGWNGTSDGIFGLAWPSVVAIYGDVSGTTARVPYNTWLWSAVNESLMDPYFTVDLKKPTLKQQLNFETIEEYGTLTLGGIPHDAPWSDKSVTLPNAGVNLGNQSYFYWAVNVTSYNFPGAEAIPQENRSTVAALLDSGTSGCQLPPPVVQAFHKAMDPPGQSVLNETIWLVQCNATIPDLSLTIGGTNFTAPGSNFVSTLGPVAAAQQALIPEGWCYSGMQNYLGSGPGEVIIGDNFYWEILTIHDMEKNEITVVQKDQ